MTLKLIIAAVTLLFLNPLVRAEHNPLNYGYIYFDNLLESNADAHTEYTRRDLVFQTGYYSFALDCLDLQISGYDALAGSDYLTALDDDVTSFTAANLQINMVMNGVNYTCTPTATLGTGGVLSFRYGRFLQHIHHRDLTFTGDDGSVLNDVGELQIAAWPDRLVMKFDAESDDVTQTSIVITSPAGAVHQSEEDLDSVILSLQPHLDETVSEDTRSPYVAAAYHVGQQEIITPSYNADLDAIEIKVDADGTNTNSDTPQIDEALFELVNPSSESINIPIYFNRSGQYARHNPGVTMSLWDESGTAPTGIPVQTSDGKGFTVITLAGGASKKLRIKMVYRTWGSAATVGHSSMVIDRVAGGLTWKWERASLHAFGESMTFWGISGEAADVRATFVPGKNTGGVYEHAINVGAMKCLEYEDEFGDNVNYKRSKTAFNWTGPNVTEIHYTMVTRDEKIRMTTVNRLYSSNDYLRYNVSYKYDFLEDVAPTRLSYFQMATDSYCKSRFDDYYVGDESGLLFQDEALINGDEYQTTFPFDDCWLAVDDLTSIEEDVDGVFKPTYSTRGLISHPTTLNGSPLKTFMHCKGIDGSVRYDGTMIFELGAESISDSYSAGDVIEGGVEYIMPCKEEADYWGDDEEFAGRLTAYGTDYWKTTFDEFSHNENMSVTAHVGTLLDNYPVEITPATKGVLADFTINSGGIGHIPMIIRDLPVGTSISVQRYNDGGWSDLDDVDIEGQNFYQAYSNENGSVDYVFSTQRPTTDLNDSWRVRVVEMPALLAYWSMDDGEGSIVTDNTGNGHDGTLTGGSWDSSGIVSGSVCFDSDGSISIPETVFDTVSDAFSIMMWVYGGGDQPQADSIFSAVDATGSLLFNIDLPRDNSMVYWYTNGESGYNEISKTASPDEFKGQWNHWAFTIDTSTGVMAVYLNGELWHSDTDQISSLGTVTKAYLASGNRELYYSGCLDEVFIYDIALSEVEINNAYGSYPSGYQKWLANNSEVEDTDVMGDSDNDGIVNLLEYALKGDPYTADADILPSVVTAQDGYLFSFERNTDASVDTTMIFQHSPSLLGAEWTDVDLADDTEVTLGVDSAGVQPVDIMLNDEDAVDGKLFGRIKVNYDE